MKTSLLRTAALLGPLLGCLLGPLLGALLLPACSPADTEDPDPETSGSGPAEQVTWPEGTVLAFGGIPIDAERIDRHLDLIHVIEPHLVKNDHRRKALTNIVLPVVAGESLFPEERQASFVRAQAMAAAARETGDVPADAPEPTYLTGTWRDVGMTVWDVARTVEPGSFSGVIETPGAWTFVHVLATGVEPGEEFGPLTPVTVQRYDVPYIEREATRDLVQSALDQLPLEIIDPDWESIVPAAYLYQR